MTINLFCVKESQFVQSLAHALYYSILHCPQRNVPHCVVFIIRLTDLPQSRDTILPGLSVELSHWSRSIQIQPSHWWEMSNLVLRSLLWHDNWPMHGKESFTGGLKP